MSDRIKQLEAALGKAIWHCENLAEGSGMAWARMEEELPELKRILNPIENVATVTMNLVSSGYESTLTMENVTPNRWRQVVAALHGSLVERSYEARVPREGSTYKQRFVAAIEALCNALPPDDMVQEWIESVDVNGEFRLQGWVLEQSSTPGWAQSIVVLDAADILAKSPEEDMGHLE